MSKATAEPNHPLAGLWQPSRLFLISNLAQSVVAHAEAAIAASDAGEALLATSRFVKMGEQLQERLTPFTAHDLDRPGCWPPAASGLVLRALLRLRDCLADLLPRREKFPTGRGRRSVMGFDPEVVYTRLKELRPVVERLRLLVREVDQLVSERLNDPGPPALSVDRAASAAPANLNETERNILEALGDATMTGEELAPKAGYECNGHFKATLSTLVKRGLLENLRPGYRRRR
jgi:hypothetical protein